MKKILICITARPSYSRIRSAILALQKKDNTDVSVLASGSALLERYGRVVDLIRADGIDVIDELYTFVEGNESINMALTTAATVSTSAAVISRLAPDLVVTIADRYETLGTAIAASYCGVPLVHIQGGEVTGNIDERVRHSVTKLSDIHMVANIDCKRRLKQMGENNAAIFVTGCPSLDIVHESLSIPISKIKESIENFGVGADVDVSKPFVMVLQHPETESYKESYDRMRKTLVAIENLDMPSLIFWPNVDAGADATSKAIRVSREEGMLKNARYIKNLDGKLFLRLLKQTKCLIGNSSVGIRECSFIGVPVVNIGDRQMGRMQAENVIDSAWNTNDILEAILTQIKHGEYKSSNIYGDGLSGELIAELLSKDLEIIPKRFVDM
jgi:UDP-hydrolysing UDP-N-acetyl-D-glucosamine 2-epimerase